MLYLSRHMSTRNGMREALKVGPTLKDFLIASPSDQAEEVRDQSSDDQSDKVPYLCDGDVAAKGRKGADI